MLRYTNGVPVPRDAIAHAGNDRDPYEITADAVEIRRRSARRWTRRASAHRAPGLEPVVCGLARQSATVSTTRPRARRPAARSRAKISAPRLAVELMTWRTGPDIFARRHDTVTLDVTAAERIRVLWLIKGLGPGGAERLLATSAALRDRDAFSYRVAYLLPGKDHLVPELEALGVPTHCLDSRDERDLRWAGRLRSLLAESPVDIVHVHSPYAAGIARLVVRTLPSRRPAARRLHGAQRLVDLRAGRHVAERSDESARRRHDRGVERGEGLARRAGQRSRGRHHARHPARPVRREHDARGRGADASSASGRTRCSSGPSPTSSPRRTTRTCSRPLAGSRIDAEPCGSSRWARARSTTRCTRSAASSVSTTWSSSPATGRTPCASWPRATCSCSPPGSRGSPSRSWRRSRSASRSSRPRSVASPSHARTASRAASCPPAVPISWRTRSTSSSRTRFAAGDGGRRGRSRRRVRRRACDAPDRAHLPAGARPMTDERSARDPAGRRRRRAGDPRPAQRQPRLGTRRPTRRAVRVEAPGERVRAVAGVGRHSTGTASPAFRLLMRWEFVAWREVLRAVRAVDTATHPDYQGRGIFTGSRCARSTSSLATAWRRVQHAERPEPARLPQDGLAGRRPGARRRARDVSPALLRMLRARVPAERWSAPSRAGEPGDASCSGTVRRSSAARVAPTAGRAITTHRVSRATSRWRYGTPLLEYRAARSGAWPRVGARVLPRPRARADAASSRRRRHRARRRPAAAPRAARARSRGLADADYVIATRRRTAAPGRLRPAARPGSAPHLGSR